MSATRGLALAELPEVTESAAISQWLRVPCDWCEAVASVPLVAGQADPSTLRFLGWHPAPHSRGHLCQQCAEVLRQEEERREAEYALSHPSAYHGMEGR